MDAAAAAADNGVANNPNPPPVPHPPIEEDEEEEGDDDEEEEDEEEEGDEEEGEEDDDEDGDGENDGIFDGGAAEQVEKGKERRKATEAEMTLFFCCDEAFDRYPDHRILKEGVTVQIGLDKTTKLSEVFLRYVQFCNERGSTSGASYQISLSDLEFVHSQILSPHDTPEAAALMKSDRIYVRKDRSSERQEQDIFNRGQRESDKAYFAQMRGLLPTNTAALCRSCDTVLDCLGPVYDESGRVQQVLSTTVRCHSAIVSKRCPWLGGVIAAARREQQEQASRSVVTHLVETAKVSQQQRQRQESWLPVALERNAKSPEPIPKESEDDDDIGVLHFDVDDNNNNNNVAPDPLNKAAKIENDEDEPSQVRAALIPSFAGAASQETDEVSVTSGRAESSSLLRVALPQFSPDAIKILLEYCYTHRVLSLGYDAFAEACKINPLAANRWGCCPPYHMNPRRWPNHGDPLVTFRTALAGLSLAEVANMPRLSLMCETAAAQLVETGNVVEALAMCETQKIATGNALVRLRKAAMEIVLRSGPRGIYSLPTFRRALEDRSDYMVPTLLQGAAEAIEGIEKKKLSHYLSSTSGGKRDWKTMASADLFDEMDYADLYARELERHKRRIERLANDPRIGSSAEEKAKELFQKPLRKDDAKRRSLKRMSHHLNTKGGGLGRRIGGGLAAISRPARRGHRHGSL